MKGNDRAVCGDGLSAALKVLISIVVLLVNPFGLDGASDDFTQAIATRVLAPHYPPDGQRLVSAVVVTDAAAERMSGAYPVAFEAHARALRSILCLDPAAVFIDLDFRYARGETDGIAQLAEALTYRLGPDGCGPRPPADIAAGRWAPVFLAVVQRAEAGPCRSLAQPDLTACPFMAPLAPLREATHLVDVTGQIDRGRYRLLTATGGGAVVESPAVLMTRALCRRHGDTLPVCSAERALLADPMVPRWGYFLSRATLERYRVEGCDTRMGESATAADRRGASVGAIGHDLVGGLRGDAGEAPFHPCPFTDHATADQFHRNPAVNSDTFLRGLVKDRAVVYGADITALPDRIVSPVHGALPGLYVHAMATDNLVTQGTRYWRDPPKVFAWSALDAAGLAEILLVLVVVAGALTLDRVWVAWSRGARFVAFALWYAAMLAVIVATAALFVWQFDWAPVNGVLLLALLSVAGPGWPCCTPVNRTTTSRSR